MRVGLPRTFLFGARLITAFERALHSFFCFFFSSTKCKVDVSFLLLLIRIIFPVANRLLYVLIVCFVLKTITFIIIFFSFLFLSVSIIINSTFVVHCLMNYSVRLCCRSTMVLCLLLFLLPKKKKRRFFFVQQWV